MIEMHYPKFHGKNSRKTALFNVDSTFPPTNANHYPMGVAAQFPFEVDVNFGFTARNQRRPGALHINTLEAIRLSADKVNTKRVWTENEMPWHVQRYLTLESLTTIDNGVPFMNGNHLEEVFGPEFKILAKPRNLSGGKGIHVIEGQAGLANFFMNVFPQIEGTLEKRIAQYYFEEFFNFDQEYRIHVSPWLLGKGINYKYNYSVKLRGGQGFSVETAAPATRNNGVILAQRKMIRQEAYNGGHRSRSSSDATYFTARFDRPAHWTQITEQALEAISLLGLDFGFIDCLYNSSTGQFRFTESGSNPGMDDSEVKPTKNVTAQHYLQAFPAIIFFKAMANNQFASRLIRDESFFTAQAQQLNQATQAVNPNTVNLQSNNPHFNRRHQIR